MEKKHIGDEKDYTKKCLFSLLKQIGFNKIHVDPMISDEDYWSENDYDKYQKSILPCQFTCKIRKGDLYKNTQGYGYYLYFENYYTSLQKEEDTIYFLDPTKGLSNFDRPTVNRRNKHYIKPYHVLIVLNDSKEHLIIIYDESQGRGETFAQYADKKQNLLLDIGIKTSTLFTNISCANYILISKDDNTIHKCADELRKVYTIRVFNSS